MKENKKKKTISKVLDFEKKITEAKSKLDSLEERKNALVAVSVVDTLQANGMTLSDFYDMVDSRDNGGKHKTIEKISEKTDDTINNDFNGGTNK